MHFQASLMKLIYFFIKGPRRRLLSHLRFSKIFFKNQYCIYKNRLSILIYVKLKFSFFFGLCYFTIHDSTIVTRKDSCDYDPTIHDSTMRDSCINYVFLCIPWIDWWGTHQLKKVKKTFFSKEFKDFTG